VKCIRVHSFIHCDFYTYKYINITFNLSGILSDPFCIAQSSEAPGLRRHSIEVDRPASVCDHCGFCDHEHRQWNLCTVGRLQKPGSGEGNVCMRIPDHIPLAHDDNAGLLLKDCLRINTEGNTRVMTAGVPGVDRIFSWEIMGRP